MPAVTAVWGPNVWAPTVWGAHVWAGTASVRAPVALFTVSGTVRTRTFDSAGSSADAGIASRAWTFGDGQAAGNTVAPTHTYAVAGTYTVTLTVTDANSVSTTFSTDVTVADPVVAGTTTTISVGNLWDTSEVRIANMALAHCGNGQLIESLTSRTKEARACNLFYTQVRDEVLREFAWPFASRRTVLALVEEDPSESWAFAYRYPTDALVVRRIPTGISRLDTAASRVVYDIGSDDVGRLIYTSQVDAEIEYTQAITNPNLFPADFVAALALRLGAAISSLVMSDGAAKTRRELLELYEVQISRARATSANEAAPDQVPDSEFISARN